MTSGCPGGLGPLTPFTPLSPHAPEDDASPVLTRPLQTHVIVSVYLHAVEGSLSLHCQVRPHVTAGFSRTLVAPLEQKWGCLGTRRASHPRPGASSLSGNSPWRTRCVTCSCCPQPSVLCPGKDMPAAHSSRAPCPPPSLSDMDSDELSRGNLEVGFRPQKSVKAEREQPPGTPTDQPQAGAPEPARGTPDVEAAAQLARPKDGGPVANPGTAEFQSCSPGWSSAFYEADCFGTDVHNYVKELEGQKAGGAPNTSSPVSGGPPSTPGLGKGAESKQEFFSQVTTPSAPLTAPP